MKKNKIIVSAVALLVGAGLAGSITGTIAWYQYSTRAAGAYVGTAGGASGNLQLRIKKDGQAANEGWVSRLTKEDVADYLAANSIGQDIQPITSGNMAKEDAIPENFYRNPLPGKAAYDSWEKADQSNYISLPLELRFEERTGDQKEYVAKDVYLTDLLIKEDRLNTAEDLSEAIRFHVSSFSSAAPTQRTNRLISKNGGTIDTHGALDLDADPGNDMAYDDKYGFDGSELHEIDYGAGQQEAFVAAVDSATDGVYPILAKTSDESLDLSNLEYNTSESKSIGKTVAGDEDLLNVEITIWVEGWQQFSNDAVWGANYIGAQFDVGFEFAVDID